MRAEHKTSIPPVERQIGTHQHWAAQAVSRLQLWRKHWRQIFQPPASQNQEECRREARLLAALLVALLIAAIIILPIWILANPEYPTALPISMGIISALLISFTLIRTQHEHIGMFVLIALFPCLVVAVIATAPGQMTERMLALNLLVVAILLASIPLDLRATLMIAVVSVLGTSIFFFVPGVPFAVTYSYLVFESLTSALFIVTAVIRNDYSRRLQQSEHRYRSLFEQSNDAVFLLDLAGVHLDVNQRAADMLGYTPQEIAGLSLWEIVVPSEHTQSETVLAGLLSNQHFPPYERLFRKKDGTVVPVEINVELVRDGDGQPMHIQSIVRDISERKRAEGRSLALAIERERVQLLARFVQNASHELRTPLSLINTSLYLMTKTTNDQ